MSQRIFTTVELENLKREAKKIRKRDGIPHVEALNRIAVREGFASWWQLQHLSGKAQPASRSIPRPIVRFVMDPKDTDGFDDEFLESRGFARDEDFTDKVAAEQYPDEPWEASGMIAVFRFIEWPSDDFGVILKRIQETFFFPPDEIWFGDEKVPDSAWINKNPSWAIVRDPGESTSNPAEAIIEDLLPELAVELTNGNDEVVGAIAETNAASFWYTQGEVELAEFDDGEDRITFTASIHLDGEQHPERPFNGDAIDVKVSGAAVRKGNGWTFSETEIEHISTNV
jgi:hypothetical protein